MAPATNSYAGGFDGKSELEIFQAVRDGLCEMTERCPLLVGDPPPMNYSLEVCRAGFDDMSNYGEPISEEARGRLAQCLMGIEQAKCDELLALLLPTLSKKLAG